MAEHCSASSIAHTVWGPVGVSLSADIGLAFATGLGLGIFVAFFCRFSKSMDTAGLDGVSKRDVIEKLKKQCYVRVKPSHIHGVGVFAIQDIPKGTNPFYACLSDGPLVHLTSQDLDKEFTEDMKTLILDFHLPIDDYIPVSKDDRNNFEKRNHLAVFVFGSATP